MLSNWPKAIPLLLISEGPELNQNPPGTPAGQGEPGGASRYGVSVAALGDLRKVRGQPAATVQDIVDLTEAQAEDFYQAVTAKACRFNDLAAGVDYAMLDVTTNLGPSGGAWLLQCVLGLWPHVSTITDEMVSLTQSIDARVLVQCIGSAWIAQKRLSPGWTKSGHGWTNRMVRVRGDSLAMTGG